MNKKLSGMFFGSSILVYSIIMTISYTSCNSDNSSDKVSTTPATDSSNITPVADTTKKASAKKIKKGKASVTISSVTSSDKSKIRKDKKGVYMQAETMPEYPGGESALSAYVESNIDYPQQALNDNKEGTVRVSFVVDEKGNVTNPEVMGNKLGDGLDQQAVTVIKNMPKWKPGTVKGKNVKTRLDLPITFKVSEEES